MNFVKRRGNSKAKVNVINFNVFKKQFISDVEVIDIKLRPHWGHLCACELVDDGERGRKQGGHHRNKYH